MSELLEVFYRPGILFAGLPERKRAWVAPVVANSLLALLMTFLLPHFIGRENLLRQQLEAFHLPPAQIQAQMATANAPGRVYGGYAGAVIGTPLVLAMISAALWAFAMMTSRVPKFASVYAMVALSFFAYSLLTTIMSAVVLIAAPDKTALDVGNLLATNVGAYVDRNTLAKGLYSLLTSLDILSFAEIGLLSYGFSKLTRVNFFFGLAAVMGLWMLYVFSKMALSLLF